MLKKASQPYNPALQACMRGDFIALQYYGGNRKLLLDPLHPVSQWQCAARYLSHAVFGSTSANNMYDNNKTCAYVACEKRHVEMLNWIVDNGGVTRDILAAKGPGGRTMLYLACEARDADMVRSLIRAAMQCHTDFNRCLSIATTVGDTPLLLAHRVQDHEITFLLEKFGVEAAHYAAVNPVDGMTCCTYAARRGNFSRVKEIMRRGHVLTYAEHMVVLQECVRREREDVLAMLAGVACSDPEVPSVAWPAPVDASSNASVSVPVERMKKNVESFVDSAV